MNTHIRRGSVTDSLEVLFNYLDEDQVQWMLMFQIAQPTASSQGRYFSRVTEFVESAQSRVVFLQGVARNEQFAQGMYDEDLLRERLQPQGPFHGVGEITLYRPEFKSITFARPEMQAVYRTVNEMGGVVMIHPRRDTRPKDPAQLEEIIKSYSNVTFLFHGHSSVTQPLLLPLMDKYPNVYFTYDVIYMISSANNQYGVRRMLDSGDPDYSKAIQNFLGNVERVGIDVIVEGALKDSSPWFSRHPDRIVLGTDRFSWMWEEPASDKFIARLPTEHQEAYAYKNALRVFGRYLIPSQ